MAGRLVARGKEAFDADEALRLAAGAVLHRIGEAFRVCPGSSTPTTPEVAWRSMKATRNMVAHPYGQVDYDMIWRAFERRLSKEAHRIREIVEQ